MEGNKACTKQDWISMAYKAKVIRESSEEEEQFYSIEEEGRRDLMNGLNDPG